MKRACLQAALNDREEWGVWGGTTPEERRRFFEPMKREVLACPECKIVGSLFDTGTRASNGRWTLPVVSCRECGLSFKGTDVLLRHLGSVAA